MTSVPKPDNEAERLLWLRQSRLLDTPPEGAFDDLTRLAAQICQVPIAGVSLIDEERQWFKSAFGFTVSQTPRAAAFCAYTILQEEVMIVADTLKDDRFRDSPFVLGEPYLRFYAGAPLVTAEGFVLGTLFINDHVLRELTAEQLSALSLLARQVTARIELQRQIVLQDEATKRQEEATKEQMRLVSDLLQMGATLQESEQRLRQSEVRLHQSEEKLRLEKERLRLALVSGSLGTFDLDLTTGKYIDLSDLWREQYGVPQDRAEFSSEEWLQIVHPEDRACTQEAMEQAIAEHHDYNAEYRIVLPGGAVRWSSAHAIPLFSAAADPLRLVGVTQDVTERKAREAAQEQTLREAVKRADSDPLTGLWNHRTFYRRLKEEITRSVRDGTRLAVVMLDLDGFSFFNNAYGHVVGDAVLRQAAERLLSVCRPYDTVARFGGDEFSLILAGIGQASPAEIEERLRAALNGLVFQPDSAAAAVPITLSLGVSVFGGSKADGLAAVQAADERLRRSKTGGGGETQAEKVRLSALAESADFSLLDALVTAVDNKDRYTRRHSEDVMTYSVMIARQLGQDAAAVRTVAVAALLHDLGKIGISDAILRKPDKLTAEEFAAMKRHPQTGAMIISAVPELEGVLDAVRHHHERWDGAGYPAGLKGQAIPLMARLMAVADAFSAMTTDRPYRKGMSSAQALAILEQGANSQWDAVCVAAFLTAAQAGAAEPLGDTSCPAHSIASHSMKRVSL